MRELSYLLLSVGLLLGTATVATALPILQIIDLESTSLAKITGTSKDGVINEWISLKEISKASLKTVPIGHVTPTVPDYFNHLNVVEDGFWLGDVVAGTLFWHDAFSNSDHYLGVARLYDDPDNPDDYTAISAEATSQLDMRFKVKGNDAIIAAGGYNEEGGGQIVFSLFDETNGTMCFNIATLGGSFLSPHDLYLTDGHTYQLHALNKVSNDYGCFYWYNSPFTITVPECSTLLLSITGLCLFLIHRRRSTM